MQIQFPQPFGGDHEKRNSINQRSLSRIFVLILCLVSTLILALPAAAAEYTAIDYNDYVTDVVVDGDNDLVTAYFPATETGAMWQLFNNANWAHFDTVYGASGTFGTVLYDESKYPSGYILGYYPLGVGYYMDLTNIPDGTVIGTELSFDFDWSGNTAGVQTPTLYWQVDYYDAAGKRLSQVWINQGPVGNFRDYENGKYNVATTYTISKPNGAVMAKTNVVLRDMVFYEPASDIRLQVAAEAFYMTFSISSLQRLQQQTGKTNELLEEVKEQLDDIYTGGEAGEDLIAGSDKLEDAGSGLGDDIGQIQDFENQYFGQLEDSLDDIVGAGDLTFLVAPLSFIHSYINKIVAGIPSKYMVIFTLPISFGIFFYIVQHPIKAPRPDTSGDQVTRETFTETTILTGKHAGETRSTRTVTTTQEIGRVHKE